MHNENCFKNHCTIWAMEQSWMQKALNSIRLNLMPLAPKMYEEGESPEAYQARKLRESAKMGVSKIVWDGYYELYRVADGVGIISLDGPLMKFDSKYGGTNTVRGRMAVRAAASDSDVGSILLRIESPGGSVAGTMEFADDVKAAAAIKTTWAYIEDIGASAAYWIAAQCSKIFCNEMALVGSIGTYVEVYDTSKMYETAGVKVHMISTGPFKGALADGTPVTEDQLAHVRGIVEGFNEKFLAAVKAGRDMSASELKAVSDGRVFLSGEAKSLRLVDGVKSFDAVMTELAAKAEKKTGARQRAKASLELDSDN